MMPIELRILALGAILLLVHIFAAGHVKTKQYGAQWNAGARDETLPPPEALTGRLMRAQANYQETFPFAIVALLGVVVAARTSAWTAIGGWTWLAARVAYLPLYALGVRYVRSIAFLISLAGLLVVIWPLILG